MTNFKALFLLVAMVFLPTMVEAEVFVNDKAPGVHQTTEFGTNEKIWVNSMGHKIANVKDAKTMADFDKDDIAYEGTHGNTGNVIIDPKKNGITKVWDNYRKCYIWKNSTGSYLGRVPTELQQKEWEKQQKDDWDKNLKLTQAAKEALNNKNINGWSIGFNNYSDLFKKNDQPTEQMFPPFPKADDDNIDCSKELNEIMSDPHMNVSLAKERLGQGDLTPKQKKALEQYISMGGKKNGKDPAEKEAEESLKDADKQIAELEKQLAEVKKAKAELKSLGGYGSAYIGDIERAESQIKAAIQKYKNARHK